MAFTSYRIGGISYSIQYDVKITSLQDGFYKYFTTPFSSPDIQQKLIGVKGQDLILPDLTAEEKRKLDKFHSPAYLGGGIQVLPLVIFKGHEDLIKPYFAVTFDENGKGNYPLLRAQQVRERLFNCIKNVEQVLVIMHPLTVEIRDYAAGQIDVFYREEVQSVWNLELALNGIERMFKALLPGFNAFPVHSSAVVRKGKAVCFLAPDKGGKTTVAKQVPEETILNDDQVILRKEEDKFRLHSTPWGSIVNGPFSAPLGAFFLL